MQARRRSLRGAWAKRRPLACLLRCVTRASSSAACRRALLRGSTNPRSTSPTRGSAASRATRTPRRSASSTPRSTTPYVCVSICTSHATSHQITLTCSYSFYGYAGQPGRVLHHAHDGGDARGHPRERAPQCAYTGDEEGAAVLPVARGEGAAVPTEDVAHRLVGA